MLALVACAALAVLVAPAHAQEFCTFAEKGTQTDYAFNMDDQRVEPDLFSLEIADADVLCAEGKPVGLKVGACDWEEEPKVYLTDTTHGLVVRNGKLDSAAILYVTVYCSTDSVKDSDEATESPIVKSRLKPQKPPADIKTLSSSPQGLLMMYQVPQHYSQILPRLAIEAYLATASPPHKSAVESLLLESKAQTTTTSRPEKLNPEKESSPSLKLETRFVSYPVAGLSSRFTDHDQPPLGAHLKTVESAPPGSHAPKVVAPAFVSHILSRYSSPNHPAPAQISSAQHLPLSNPAWMKLDPPPPPQGPLLNNRFPVLLTRKSLLQPYFKRRVGRSFDDDSWPDENGLELHWFEDKKDNQYSSITDLLEPEIHSRIAYRDNMIPRYRPQVYDFRAVQRPPQLSLPVHRGSPRYRSRTPIRYHSRIRVEDGAQQPESQSHSTPVQSPKRTTVPKLLLLIHEQDPTAGGNCANGHVNVDARSAEDHGETLPNYEDGSAFILPYPEDYSADDGDGVVNLNPVPHVDESQPLPHTRVVEDPSPSAVIDPTHVIAEIPPAVIDPSDPCAKCQSPLEYFDDGHGHPEQVSTNSNEKVDFPVRGDTQPHYAGTPQTERPLLSSTVRNTLLWKKISSSGSLPQMRISLGEKSESVSTVQPWSFLSRLLMSHPTFRESTQVIRI